LAFPAGHGLATQYHCEYKKTDMNLGKNDYYFIVSLLATIFIPTGLLFDLGKKNPQLIYILLIIMTSVTVCFFYKSRFGVCAVRNGLKYFERELEKRCKLGGMIFTTALFENYEDEDIIKSLIKKKEKVQKKLVFERFVFLDDPTFEFQWITDFLKLQDNVENLKTVIFRVGAEKRAISRKIAQKLPRFSVSIFYDSNGKILSTYIGFPGAKNKKESGFGLTTKNPCINSLLAKHINGYKEQAQRIENVHEIPPLDKSFGLPLRFVSSLEEYARSGSFIEFIAVFGSQGLVFQNKLAMAQKHVLEGDLDIIIVIAHDTDIREFQRQIKILLTDQTSSAEKVSIEWSNIEGKYYEKREPIHIDIQLHKGGDNYYLKNQILGYSIFDSSLYTVYSKENKTVQQHIQYPENAVEHKERIEMVLNSAEYGIKTAIQRINDRAYINTDPRRIVWISIQNYIWALTGYRIRTKENAYLYIKKLEWFSTLESDEKNSLDEFFNDTSMSLYISKDTTERIITVIANELQKCLD
jgi:hypothetical protein